GRRGADEVDGAGDALQLLRRIGSTSVDHELRAELAGGRELRLVDVARDDVLHALGAQHRNARQADAAAADHGDAVARGERRQLGARAVGGDARAGERGGEGLVDSRSVHEVLRVGHEHVRGVRASAVDADDAASRNAVVVLSGLAHRALAAADPRVDQAFLADLHAFHARADLFDDAKGLVAEGERRDAAALLDVEALAAAEVEEAFPDVHVRMTDAAPRDAHQHFAAGGPRRFQHDFLQRLAVLDDLIADHAFPASFSA